METTKGLAVKTLHAINNAAKFLFRRVVPGKRPARKRFRLEWITVSGDLSPDIDPADRDALIERMEGRS